MAEEQFTEIPNESLRSESVDGFVVVRDWTVSYYSDQNGIYSHSQFPQIIVFKPEEEAPVSVHPYGIDAHSPAKATLFGFKLYSEQGEDVVYTFKNAYVSPDKKKDLLVARKDITGAADANIKSGEFPYNSLSRDFVLAGPDSALEQMLVRATQNRYGSFVAVQQNKDECDPAVVPKFVVPENGSWRFEPNPKDRKRFAKEAAAYLLKQR